MTLFTREREEFEALRFHSSDFEQGLCDDLEQVAVFYQHTSQRANREYLNCQIEGRQRGEVSCDEIRVHELLVVVGIEHGKLSFPERIHEDGIDNEEVHVFACILPAVQIQRHEA